MKSGLEGRNNSSLDVRAGPGPVVSMKSGLEGRNNASVVSCGHSPQHMSQ